MDFSAASFPELIITPVLISVLIQHRMATEYLSIPVQSYLYAPLHISYKLLFPDVLMDIIPR
jgi:hypothetical protein